LLGLILPAFIVVAVVSPITSKAQTKEAAEAQSLFKQDCAMCHGADARGQTPMGKRLNIADLHAPTVQKKTDAALTAIIGDGKGKMPAFNDKLKPEQIHDLATYIRNLAKQAPKPGQPTKQ